MYSKSMRGVASRDVGGPRAFHKDTPMNPIIDSVVTRREEKRIGSLHPIYVRAVPIYFTY